MASGSFNQDQIRHFRQVFSQYRDSESGGVTVDNFLPAVNACLEQIALASPPQRESLSTEFSRLSGEGTLSWQQFFQVGDCERRIIPLRG